MAKETNQNPSAPNTTAEKRHAGMTRSGGEYKTATKYDGQYQLSGLMYPDDLMGTDGKGNNQYGGNYAIFYINVHEDSKIIKQWGGESDVVGDATKNQLDGVVGYGYTESNIRASADILAGVVGYTTKAGTKAVESASGVRMPTTAVTDAKGNKIGTGAAGKILNVVTGVGSAELGISAIGSTTKKYKRLKQAVALYMPNDLQINYGVEWGQEDLAGATLLPTMLNNLGRIGSEDAKTAGISNIISAATSKGGAALSAVKDPAAAYAAGKLMQTPGMGQLVGKMTGAAANPKAEQLFKRVNFRDFSFTYNFFPRSSSEAKNALKIIEMFKLHMHPEFKDAANFLYIYPSEFDIYYYQNGTENMNLHRHTSCVLTNMNVNYAPEGTFTTFPDGMPTHITITLSFRELAALSKESIKDGF